MKAKLRIYPKARKRMKIHYSPSTAEAIRVQFQGREKWFRWEGWPEHHFNSIESYSAYSQAHALRHALETPGPSRERALRSMK